MRGNSPHERRIEILNEVRRKNDKILIIIEEHQHDRARLIDAHIRRACHGSDPPAQYGIRLIKKENAPCFCRGFKSAPDILWRFPDKLGFNICIIDD